MIALVLSGLICGRGRRALTHPLDLRIEAGEALVVTGPNGAGKSTFLRTLAGLLPPSSGHAHAEGARTAEGEATRRIADDAHYLGHRNALKAARTVEAELRFWRDHDGRPMLDIAQALEAVDLPGAAQLPVGALSAGQQRRAAFARLLVSERAIWLLDEPTTALDAASQGRISQLCRAHQARGGIVVAATHQPMDLIAARALALEAAVPPPLAEAGEGWDEIG